MIRTLLIFLKSIDIGYTDITYDINEILCIFDTFSLSAGMRWSEMGSVNRSRIGTRSTPEGNAERKVQENPSHPGKSCELCFGPTMVLFSLVLFFFLYQNAFLFLHSVHPKSLRNVMNQKRKFIWELNVPKY